MRFLHWLLSLTGLLTTRRRRRSLLHMPERLETRAYLSSFVVTSTEDAPDANPGDGLAETAAGETTLRAAVEEANASPRPDNIELPAGVFNLTGSDLDITEAVEITGAGSDETVITATDIDQAFHILNGATLELDSLSVTTDADTEPVLIEDGSLATDETTVAFNDFEAPETDAPATDSTELPVIGSAAIVVSPRQSEFLTALYQSRPARQDEAILFQNEPIIVDQRIRLDAMHDISNDDLISDDPTDPAERTGDTPTPTPEIEQPVIAADMNDVKADSEETPDDKRQKVLNALFENRPDAPPSVKNVSNEEVEQVEAEKTRDTLPPLLPMKKDGELQVVPNDPHQDRPAPPPLPEFKLNAANAHRPAAGTQVAVTGVLMSVVRPTAWKRTLRRISKWSRLVV